MSRIDLGPRASSGSGAAMLDPDTRAHLEEERAFLLRSLDDLDRERAAGNLSASDYERLHGEYTAQAAAVIRTLRDGVDVRPRVPRVPVGRRVGVALALVAFVVAGGYALAKALGGRIGNQTGTGNAQIDPKVRQARFEAQVKERPKDPTAHLQLARFLLQQGEFSGALREFDEVAELDPKNAEAQAYGAWIISLTAMQLSDVTERATLVDRAMARLDAVVRNQPTYPDAHFFRAMTLLRGRSDIDGAIPELQAYLSLDGEGPQANEVRQTLAALVERQSSSTTLGAFTSESNAESAPAASNASGSDSLTASTASTIPALVPVPESTDAGP